MHLMFRTIDEQNVRLGNALDVDLKIICSQNVQSHQKMMRNGESKYILMKKVIVHSTTTKITVTERYMHLWHVCLAMMNVVAEVFVTVRN